MTTQTQHKNARSRERRARTEELSDGLVGEGEAAVHGGGEELLIVDAARPVRVQSLQQAPPRVRSTAQPQLPQSCR